MIGFGPLGRYALGQLSTPPGIAASTGTFTLSGPATTFAATMPAAAGAFTLSGQAATLNYASGRRIIADAGAFTLTGQAAGLRATHTLAMSAGSFALTGIAATFGVSMPAAGGTFTVTMQSALGAVVMPANTGSFVLTGKAALFAVAMPATSGAFTLTGQSAGLRGTHILYARNVPPDEATHFLFAPLGAVAIGQMTRTQGQAAALFALTGQQAGLRKGRGLTAEEATYTLIVNDAGLRTSRNAVTNVRIFPRAGSGMRAFARGGGPSSVRARAGSAVRARAS